jgi:hypothetical protein
MITLEEQFRRWLDKRWRARASEVQVEQTIARVALEAERASIADEMERLMQRIARLQRAERDDGADREDIVEAYKPPPTEETS